jgi:nucleoside-diphosphate-sugar epimerase
MPERILLTGASGLIGRATLPSLLAAGAELHGLTRGAPPDIPGVAWHRADVLDLAAMRALLRDLRPTLLIHAAWYVEHGKFWTSPENFRWVEASLALADAFAEAGGRRVVGLGTGAEYAASAPGDGEPWPETRPVDPATPYGQAKAQFHARLAADPRLSTAWARIFHVFGPGEPRTKLVPDVALSLMEGREARTGSGRAIRDYVSARFTGRALAALALSDVTGAVNIGSGRPVAIREVVETLGRILGRPDLIGLGARPDAPGEIPYMGADITRVRRDVGFTEPHDLEAELRATVEALRP